MSPAEYFDPDTTSGIDESSLGRTKTIGPGEAAGTMIERYGLLQENRRRRHGCNCPHEPTQGALSQAL